MNKKNIYIQLVLPIQVLLFSISKYLGAQLHIGPEEVSVQLC